MWWVDLFLVISPRSFSAGPDSSLCAELRPLPDTPTHERASQGEIWAGPFDTDSAQVVLSSNSATFPRSRRGRALAFISVCYQQVPLRWQRFSLSTRIWDDYFSCRLNLSSLCKLKLTVLGTFFFLKLVPPSGSVDVLAIPIHCNNSDGLTRAEFC